MIKNFIARILLLLFLIPNSPISAATINPAFTVNDNQFFFVSNPSMNRVQVYDSYGTYIKDALMKEKPGNIQKIVSCPCGGYLLIVDSVKKEILVVDDYSGDVTRRIKGIASIGDISISREKSRYEGIVNLSTNSIHLYSEKGSLLRIIKGDHLFKEASQIHMNFQNHIFVADNKSQKLLELDVKGNLIKTIQSSDFPFVKILDITSDQSGNFYVLDEKKGLYQFSKEGKKLRNIPYPTNFKPMEIGIDDVESSIYLFSETLVQKLSLNFVIQSNITTPLLLSKKTVIQLKIGSRIMTPVGYDAKIMDTAPFIEASSNRTFVPLRVISESFKAQVMWDSKLRQVTVQKPGIKIVLWIDNKTAKINGISKVIDAAPLIKDSRTFVPLRFIGEAFSAEIQWYSEKRLIRIVSPFIE
jgi:hypothetical protein